MNSDRQNGLMTLYDNLSVVRENMSLQYGSEVKNGLLEENT
jgi:hypothetical protein